MSVNMERFKQFSSPQRTGNLNDPGTDPIGAAVNTTTSGIAGAKAGAKAGGAIGSLLGPVGTTVGAVIGGIVGGFGGATMGFAASTGNEGAQAMQQMASLGGKASSALSKKPTTPPWSGEKSASTVPVGENNLDNLITMSGGWH